MLTDPVRPGTRAISGRDRSMLALQYATAIAAAVAAALLAALR